MKKYLIIGNGAAGTTAAEYIRKTDSGGHITLITGETFPFYSRIRLPDYLCGKIEKDDLILKDMAWHTEQAINLLTGTNIKEIDFQRKKAVTDKGKEYAYDCLLLATGSVSFIPPVKGSDKKNVFSLRTVEDAENLLMLDKNIKDLVLIGGGLLGLEAGSAMMQAGKNVTVVEFFDRLLPRQLDYEGADRLRVLLEDMGLMFRLGQATEEIMGKDSVQGVRLKSGETLKADVVLFSAGVRSNLSLVGNSGMKTDRGIVVNEQMQTSLQDVYAAGDAAQYDGVNFCIWPEAVDQGRVAGINMAGGNANYVNNPPSNILKVAGIALASAGDIDVDSNYKSDIISSEKVYKKIVNDNNGKIIGCIMLGDTKDFNKILKNIKGE